MISIWKKKANPTSSDLTELSCLFVHIPKIRPCWLLLRTFFKHKTTFLWTLLSGISTSVFWYVVLTQHTVRYGTSFSHITKKAYFFLNS